MSSKIKCLQTIIGNNGSNRPGSVVSLDALGITRGDAEVLVDTSAAVWAKGDDAHADEPAADIDPAAVLPVPESDPAVMLAPAQPDVADAPPAAVPADAILAGVVDAGGNVVALEDMKRADLAEIAKDLGIKINGMDKQQIVDAIRAEKVDLPDDDSEAEGD